MIVVVADNPSMGATYRMPAALSPLAKDGRVKTVVRQLDGWREWSADVVLGATGQEATYAIAQKLIDQADWLLVMGITGLDVLDSIYGPGVADSQLPPIVMYHVESFYRDERAHAANLLATDIGAVATFAMPDLWAGGQCPPGTIPLLQPMIVPPQPPACAAGIYIVHSPGTEKKAKAKGTPTIEEGVALAAEHIGRELTFESIIGHPHQYVLDRKAIAHICIDQVPGDEYPTGLGNSGCEGLALACHTISKYNVDTSEYFGNPPVEYAASAGDISLAILDYWQLGVTRRQRQRQRAWAWAKAHLDLGSGPTGGSWLAYFRKHLPTAILERCKS